MAPDVVPFVHAGGSFLHLCGFLLHHDKLRVELEVEWDETGRCYLIDMSFDSDPNDRIVVCTSANSREVPGTLALPHVCIQIPVLISGSEQVFLRVCGCSFPSLGLGNWWYSLSVSWQSLGKKWWGFWAAYDVTKDSVLILATLS